jgi:hypothetical protein
LLTLVLTPALLLLGARTSSWLAARRARRRGAAYAGDGQAPLPQPAE